MWLAGNLCTTSSVTRPPWWLSCVSDAEQHTGSHKHYRAYSCWPATGTANKSSPKAWSAFTPSPQTDPAGHNSSLLWGTVLKHLGRVALLVSKYSAVYSKITLSSSFPLTKLNNSLFLMIAAVMLPSVSPSHLEYKQHTIFFSLVNGRED